MMIIDVLVDEIVDELKENNIPVIGVRKEKQFDIIEIGPLIFVSVGFAFARVGIKQEGKIVYKDFRSKVSDIIDDLREVND